MTSIETLRKEVVLPHSPTKVWVALTDAQALAEWLMPNGTRLVLEQSGLENLTLWWRFSMKMGWGRMLKTLLPKVLDSVSDGEFTPGAITKRDYGVKTVPDDFAK